MLISSCMWWVEIAEGMIFRRRQNYDGASSDIKMVSDMARRMVTEWGMSEKLGFLAYGADQQEVFLRHSVTQTKNLLMLQLNPLTRKLAG